MNATLPPVSPPPAPQTADTADATDTDASQRATAWYAHSRAVFSGGN